MSKTRLTCENCGFDEELGGKELKKRMAEDGSIACSACGVKLPLPEGLKAPKPKKVKPAKKARYAGADDMTGLDDVAEGDILDDDLVEDDMLEYEPDKAAPSPADAVTDEPVQEAVTDEAAPQTEQPEALRGRAGQAAGAAKEKLKGSLRYGRENPLFVADILDKIFRRIAQSAHGSFDNVAAASVRIGHYTLLATSGLALVFGLLISLRSLNIWPLLAGLTLTALLLFAQYLALRGMDLLKGYIEKNPSRLPGVELTDIASALAALFALLSLLAGLILTAAYASPVWLGAAALGLISGYFLAAAFVECGSRLNVSFDASLPAGRVFIELARTLLKALVALAPFLFGLGSAAMALCMIWPAGSMLLFSLSNMNTASFFFQENGLLLCAFSPILIYFIILFGDFIIYIINAIVGNKD